MKTYEVMTIDGIQMHLSPTGKVSWCSDWGINGIYLLESKGYVRSRMTGGGISRHVSFSLTPKGEEVASRRTEQVA